MLPNATTRDVEPVPSQRVDPWLYRLVIGFLGAALILSILLIGLLSYQGRTGSDLLIAVPAAVVAGLVGMLVPSPMERRP
jgi:hypothetical protein